MDKYNTMELHATNVDITLLSISIIDYLSSIYMSIAIYCSLYMSKWGLLAFVVL